MPQLIKDRVVVEDDWIVVRDAAPLAALPAGAPVIVPLALWLSDHAALKARGPTGVWLSPSDDPAALADYVATLQLIAVDFPQFGDGRGYSTARLLREKYAYRGELRAIGDILRDQLYYLEQCGFNAFAVRPDQDITKALDGLHDFRDSYQSTVLRPVPLFRRRLAGAQDQAMPAE